MEERRDLDSENLLVEKTSHCHSIGVARKGCLMSSARRKSNLHVYLMAVIALDKASNLIQDLFCVGKSWLSGGKPRMDPATSSNTSAFERSNSPNARSKQQQQRRATNHAMTFHKNTSSSSVGEHDSTPPLNDSLLDLWLESQDPLLESPILSRKQSTKQKTEEDICCQLCYRGDDEKHLLLCDKCNDGYHMQCLTPPVSKVPKGKWYCWMCAATPVEVLHPLSTPKPTQITKNESSQPLPKTTTITKKREIIELESDSEKDPQEGEWMSKKKLKQESQSTPEKQPKKNNADEHVNPKKTKKQKSKPKKTEEQKKLELKVLKRLSKISESLSELKGKYGEVCTKDDFF